MTNVPTSSQTRPPGLAITSAQQAPGECLRVSVAGKELFSATFQTDQRSGGARSSFRAGCGDPAASPLAPGAGVPGRGSPPGLRAQAWVALVPGRASQPFSSRPEVARRHPRGSGHPSGAHPRRRAGRTPRPAEPRGARRFRSWKGCAGSRATGRTGRASNAFLTHHQPRISTLGMTPARDCHPPGVFWHFFSPSFSHFQDFSCINITSNRFLFIVGINLHLLGEALAEFPPAFPP